MNNNCTFDGDRDGTLVAYVYDEIDPQAKDLFEAHLAACAMCLHEVSELRAARHDLKAWQPPDGAIAWHSLDEGSMRRWWQAVPVWAQAAAVILVAGIGAGAANVRVTYAPEGVTVATGWLAAAAPAPALASGPASSSPAPWRADLDALAGELRTELRTAAVANAPAGPVAVRRQATGEDAVKQMRALVAESERRQQRELALRVAELVRDVQSQREADLVKIDHSLGILQNNTGAEVMRQRQLINSLAVRVSQRQ